MSTYQYIAVDKSGKKKRGTVEADNPKNARTKIKELGLIPSEIKEGAAKTTGGKSEESSFSFKSFLEPRMSNANLCLITRQISTLVSSSMPLEETLRAVSQQCENPKHAAIINAVRDKVCEGLTLADSMKKFPRVFDDLYVSMVAAGEKSGHLDDVLERLADYTENKQDLKAKVTQSMIYPVVLTLVATSVIGILLSTVVPKVVEQFIHMKATLPKSTLFMIALSNFVKSYGIFIVIGGIMLAMLFSFAMRRNEFKKRVHGIILKLPVIGKVSRSLNTARYAQTLCILHSSAVPLIEGMRVACDTLTNVIAKEKLYEASEKVREGKGLSRSLSETKLFSPMMLHMIASGEKSGELDNMLGRAATNQSNEFKRNVAMALAVFEPMLIICMAGVVLFIVISILQPLLQMNTMVGGR